MSFNHTTFERVLSLLRRGSLLGFIAFSVLLLPTKSPAPGCDALKSTDNDFFPAALGSITRPVLIPGFPVEVLVRSATCDQFARSAGPDFTVKTPGCDNDETPCAPLSAADLQVNLVYTPAAGDSHVVVLKEDCSAPLDTAGCSVPPERIHCVPQTAPFFAIRERSLPGVGTQRRLQFTYPDTSGLTASGYPLAGPVTVAVSMGSVPCDLATTECKDFSGSLVSCADKLFKRDSLCSTDDSRVDPTAVNVTAVPVPTRYVDVCASASNPLECLAASGDPGGSGPEIPFAQNKRGDIITVIANSEVLVRIDGENFPRRVRGALGLKGESDPLPLKENHFLSRATNFARITPIFEPLVNPEPGREGEFFGTTDTAFMLGIGKAHSCANDPSVPCNVDTQCQDLDCPGGGGACDKSCSVENYPLFCGPGSETEAYCTLGGAGPVLGQCPLDAAGIPRCRLGGTITIDALASAGLSDQALPLPINECVGQTRPEIQPQRNDDPDQQDVIFTVLDRKFGFEERQIGTNGASGVANTRIIDQPPFSFQTHAAEANVFAFVETEFGECDPAGNCDQNGNGTVFDNLLRVLRLDPEGTAAPEDLLASPDIVSTSPVGLPLAVDAALNVNLTPVVVDQGLVFFRVRQNVARTLSLAIDAGDATQEPSLSPDGGFLAVATDAALDSRDKNRTDDVYLLNRGTGEVTPVSTKIRDDCTDGARFSKGASFDPSVSADGRFVAFTADAEALLDRPKGRPQDRNDVSDIYLSDVATCNVERVSVSSAGDEANGASFSSSISGDGNFVVFVSLATNLDPADSQSDPDVYLHDRASGATILISSESSASGTISEDGISIAFESDGPAPGDDDIDVLVDDGVEVVEASVASDGTSANAGAFDPFISASGRFIVYSSDASNLVDGDVDGKRDVFVHDRETGATRRAGVNLAPRECREPGLPDPALDPNGLAGQPVVSADGRFLFYASTSTNLVPDGGDPIQHVYVEDLKTGATLRLSQNPVTGAPGLDDARAPSISSEGSVVAFETLDASLAGGQNGQPNVVVSEGGFGGATQTVLGVLDTRTAPATLHILDAAAEFVKVANGVAIFVAPGENVKLFRFTAGGPIVEDLLRPGISAADAISISDEWACALVADPGGPSPACHRIGDPPNASLNDIAAAGVTADSIQVSGENVVFIEDGLLYKHVLGQPGAAVVVQPVEDVVLGDVACFRTSESVTGDLNGDGDELDAIMFVDDPADGTDPTSCGFSASPCDLATCEPRQKYLVLGNTCKFLTDEELQGDCLANGRDLNNDGKCTVLLRRCTLGLEPTEVVLGSITSVDAESQFANPLAEAGGDVIQAAACVNPGQPEVATGPPCPCDSPEVCSDTLGIFFTLNCADPDGDGICDFDDVCEDIANPDPVDFDQDGIPDACDSFVCGNGNLESGEICDFSVNPIGCTNACTPTPPSVGISENAVNPGQQGNLPGILLSTPVINLDVVERGGQPPRMVDSGSLRMAAIVGGVCPGKECVGGSNDGSGCGENADCTGGFCGGSGDVCVAAGALDGTTCASDAECGTGTCGGAQLAHDLTTDGDYAGHLQTDANGDGSRELTLHFRVPGSGITSATEELCVKGRYNVAVDPTQPAGMQLFVTKDTVNTN